ncbi:hypothetical protein [Hydrogenovibrio halophilus]|uniref:hypothetical protein n=1 Tax=Hydrogenovibrio halophilus TaxID=373391 RepID=UPI000379E638|nr:hypothetical protein [Hydrogenovibrio halophilus]
MAKIDEIKEKIGAIKTYLGFVVAFLITIGAGVAKLYLNDSAVYLQALGAIGLVLFSIIFAFLAKTMHKKIQSLRNIDSKDSE